MPKFTLDRVLDILFDASEKVLNDFYTKALTENRVKDALELGIRLETVETLRKVFKETAKEMFSSFGKSNDDDEEYYGRIS